MLTRQKLQGQLDQGAIYNHDMNVRMHLLTPISLPCTTLTVLPPIVRFWTSEKTGLEVGYVERYGGFKLHLETVSASDPLRWFA